MSAPPLVILDADTESVSFATTGRVVRATEDRLINAMPTILKHGSAWVQANAVNESDVTQLRAAIRQAREDATVTFCANHPDEPATGEDINGTQLCDGCGRGLDARDEAAAGWDS